MRKYYFHRHPRNFANECHQLSATTAEQMAELEALGYQRMTLLELKRHLAWMNGENEAWGSNRPTGNYTVDQIESATAWVAQNS
jgi:hypothetical protein